MLGKANPPIFERLHFVLLALLGVGLRESVQRYVCMSERATIGKGGAGTFFSFYIITCYRLVLKMKALPIFL